MIHSLAGGELKQNKTYDFAKVVILDGLHKNETFWYVCNLPNINEDDVVIVPVGKNNLLVKAKIIRIDKNISQQTAPIRINQAKEILKKLWYWLLVLFWNNTSDILNSVSKTKKTYCENMSFLCLNFLHLS